MLFLVLLLNISLHAFSTCRCMDKEPGHLLYKFATSPVKVIEICSACKYDCIRL